MRSIAILTSVVLFAGCSERPTPKELIDPGQGLAGIQLGMTTDAVRKQLGPPSQALGPDRNGRSALTYPDGFAVVCNSNSIVIAIQAGDKFRGHTKEGVGIGSSKEDVMRAFGTPDSMERGTDTSATFYYTNRGLKLKISTNGAVEHITVRPIGMYFDQNGMRAPPKPR